MFIVIFSIPLCFTKFALNRFSFCSNSVVLAVASGAIDTMRHWSVNSFERIYWCTEGITEVMSEVVIQILIEAYSKSKLKTEKMPKIFQIFKDDFSLLNNFWNHVQPEDFEFFVKSRLLIGLCLCNFNQILASDWLKEVGNSKFTGRTCTQKLSSKEKSSLILTARVHGLKSL